MSASRQVGIRAFAAFFETAPLRVPVRADTIAAQISVHRICHAFEFRDGVCVG